MVIQNVIQHKTMKIFYLLKDNCLSTWSQSNIEQRAFIWGKIKQHKMEKGILGFRIYKIWQNLKSQLELFIKHNPLISEEWMKTKWNTNVSIEVLNHLFKQNIFQETLSMFEMRHDILNLFPKHVPSTYKRQKKSNEKENEFTFIYPQEGSNVIKLAKKNSIMCYQNKFKTKH